MKPLIFAAANGSDPHHGVGDKTPDIRQSPIFAGRNGQRGREMKPLIFAAANGSDPRHGVGDKTPIFVKGPYLLVGTASRAGR